jgi:2'-5' RNA ligase
METGARTARLFYALWPDAATRMKLAALQQQVSGRLMSAQNLHLTLAFLGNQPQTRLPDLEQVLYALPLQSMQLEIDSLDYFNKPRIAWAGPSAAPQALFGLQRDLMTALEAAQFNLKPVAGFRPHITLARDALPPLQTEIQSIEWQVGEIALLESISSTQGPHYQVLAQRTLR